MRLLQGQQFGDLSNPDRLLDGTEQGHLRETLQDDTEEERIEAANVIRSLVEDIILTPVEGKVEIDVRGDLAGIVTLSVERKNPAAVKAAGSQRWLRRPDRTETCQFCFFSRFHRRLLRPKGTTCKIGEE